MRECFENQISPQENVRYIQIDLGDCETGQNFNLNKLRKEIKPNVPNKLILYFDYQEKTVCENGAGFMGLQSMNPRCKNVRNLTAHCYL
jgi:hypothetical protein